MSKSKKEKSVLTTDAILLDYWENVLPIFGNNYASKDKYFRPHMPDIVTTIPVMRDYFSDLKEKANLLVKNPKPADRFNGIFSLTTCTYVSSRFFDRYISFYENNDTCKQILKLKAASKFKAVNAEGAKHNARIGALIPLLDDYENSHQISSDDYALLSILREMRGLLSFIEVPDNVSKVVEMLQAYVVDGPNGAVGIKRNESNLVSKALSFSGTARVLNSPLALRIVDYNRECSTTVDRLRDLSLLPSNEMAVVDGNELDFVPKKYNTSRTIAKEPVLNMRGQQALAKYLTKKLRKIGIDLSTQQDVHRVLVKKISKHGLPWATIDWSEASDRLWYMLVKAVLPPRIFYLLALFRCDQTKIAGEPIELSMFSTMGNAATFPLETLLFWAFCTAIHRHDTKSLPVFSEDEITISVFGDDCIVPARCVPSILEYAPLLGWKVNFEKSFSQGPFRESCGSDCYHGLRINGPRPNFSGYALDTIVKKNQFACELSNIINETLDLLVEVNGADFYGLISPHDRLRVLGYHKELRFFLRRLSKHGIRLPLVPSQEGTSAGIRISYNEIVKILSPMKDATYRYLLEEDVITDRKSVV